MGEMTFKQRLGPPSERGTSGDDGFVLVKSDPMLAFYEQLGAWNPKTILEVGMYEGGSLVWFDQMYKPETLVGLDARSQPIEALEHYRSDREHVKTFYGCYQEKPETLQIAKDCFPNGIDLVVDDASHHYEQTKATFEMLFPMVNPGGHYVIEDWSWSLGPGRQEPEAVWYDRPALANLIFEIILHIGNSTSIERVHLQQDIACVTRGRDHHRPLDETLLGRLRGRDLTLI